MMRFIFPLRALCLITVLAVLTTAQAEPKKIVFLSGTKDHGMLGRHEYEKDLRTLAQCLDTSPNLHDVVTKVYVGKAPKDLSEIQDAAVFVIESSSDRSAKEIHPLFPPDPNTDHHTYDPETLAYLKQFDALTKKGAGIVIFHYATWVENWAARAYYLEWTGGLWVQMVSKNPVDQWSMTLRNENHPVLRGVHPWSYRDEVFCRFFLPEDAKRTDLIVAVPTKSTYGPQVASWAYQRAEGGRGFVMGGVDWHDNLQIEDFRRFLLNGIVWAAQIEVPEGGVQSTLPKDF